MQPEYMRAILELPLSSVRTLERKYRLPRRGSLFFRLCDAGIDHAAATLTLLYAGDYDGVAAMLGKPVTICPACLSKLRIPPPLPSKTADQRRIITTVDPNPRNAKRPSHARYDLLKPGLTVEQALSRGITRRDLRWWEREGSIEIKEAS